MNEALILSKLNNLHLSAKAWVKVNPTPQPNLPQQLAVLELIWLIGNAEKDIKLKEATAEVFRFVLSNVDVLMQGFFKKYGKNVFDSHVGLHLIGDYITLVPRGPLPDPSPILEQLNEGQIGVLHATVLSQLAMYTTTPEQKKRVRDLAKAYGVHYTPRFIDGLPTNPKDPAGPRAVKAAKAPDRRK